MDQMLFSQQKRYLLLKSISMKKNNKRDDIYSPWGQWHFLTLYLEICILMKLRALQEPQ